MYRYEAKLDNLARVLTVVVFCVLIIPIAAMINQIQQGHHEMYIIVGAVVIGLVIAFLFRPKYYTVSKEEILVHRPISDYKIPIRDIVEMKKVTKKELGWGIRLFGSGGLFGYYGLFRYKELGRTIVYATDLAQLILITTSDDKKIILSPHDAEDFILRIKEIKR